MCSALHYTPSSPTHNREEVMRKFWIDLLIIAALTAASIVSVWVVVDLIHALH